MKKFKWFFSVTDTDSANEAIKIAYLTAFVIAAIQTVVFGFIYWSNPALLTVNLFDPVLMASLGLLLRNRPSRFAALTLFLHSIFIASLTFAARTGILTGVNVGGNMALAILYLYAGYKGVQGTFGFHKIHKTKTNIKNLFLLSVIVLFYAIGVTAIYIGAMFIPPLEPMFANMSESLIGVLWIVSVVLVVFLGSLGLLPGTKTIKVVKRP